MCGAICSEENFGKSHRIILIGESHRIILIGESHKIIFITLSAKLYLLKSVFMLSLGKGIILMLVRGINRKIIDIILHQCTKLISVQL